jgi:hypothetical protein
MAAAPDDVKFSSFGARLRQDSSTLSEYTGLQILHYDSLPCRASC